MMAPRPVITLEQDASIEDHAIGQIRAALRDAGAALVRTPGGFSRDRFRALGQALTGGSLHSGYGDLPRIADDPEIYHSTPYPPRQRILWHHEAAHTHEWPIIQLFRCVVAAQSGGATGTADSREVWTRLPAPVAGHLTRHGLRYIRNFRPGLDTDWRTVFQVNDEDELAGVCTQHSIDHGWLPGGTLRTSIVTPATVRVDGRVSFANQILLHHASALPAKVHDALLGTFGEREAFPRHAQFGDGSEIPDELVSEILALYDEIGVRRQWQPGDVIVLDNRITAHSRDSFAGPRQIEVALGAFRPRPRLR
jgi:alpha-ketoglutarate-dependent taurine dioxygenase